jgi:hypothetical protein
LEVSWQKYTALPSVTTAAAGETVIFNVTTEGVEADTVVYWQFITALEEGNVAPTQGELTLAANGSASQEVTLSDPLTQSGTLLFKLYSDQARTRQIAEATAVAVIA